MFMRMMMVLCGLAIPLAAQADDTTAGNCAADLKPESKLIYDKTSENLAPDSDLKKVIEKETRALVHDGKVSMWSARESAEAAYPCLEKLHADKSTG